METEQCKKKKKKKALILQKFIRDQLRSTLPDNNEISIQDIQICELVGSITPKANLYKKYFLNKIVDLDVLHHR